MSLIESVFMGLIQGLTEFLPVSSSGHLAIFKNIFHVNTDTGMLFDILLHFGTLMAVILVYRKDILKMITEGFGLIGDACCNLAAFSAVKKKKKHPYIERWYATDTGNLICLSSFPRFLPP